MDDSAFSAIQTLLDADERLLWSGQPRRGIRLRPQDAYMIPFSLLWGGFAFFWESMVVFGPARGRPHGGSASGAPIFFMLWGVPFVLMGIYVIIGRFFVDAWSRERTRYAVTNERVIIESGLFTRQTKSLQLRTLSDVSLTERAGGNGAITFGPASFPASMFSAGGWPGSGRSGPPAFELLENAREVYDLIRRAQKAAFAKT